MKKIRIISFVLAIVMVTVACGLPQGTPTVTSAPPTDLPQATLPPEPVFNFPAVDGEIVFSSFDENLSRVMVMNADGSDQTDLTSDFGEYSYPAWSPDGQRLAMRIDFGTGNGIAIMDVQGTTNDLSGTLPVAISTAFSDAPDWSPDGSQLVFMSSGFTGWDLNRYAVDSANLVQIPGVSNWLRDPKWSPDGQKILFGADVGNNGNSDIYLVNLDGSGLTQLTFNPFYEGSPNWSPDGLRIVFSADANENQDLFTMNLDGSGLMQLTNDPADEFDAAWSPDGTRIAFVSTRNDSNFGNNYEIYVINADGSAEMRLTYNQANDRWPDWRPGSTATGQPACLSQAAASADVTIPAGTRFATPTTFTKVWRLVNTGQCTFTPNAFRLRFVGGDLMGAPAAIPMPGAILPGSSVDISAQFTSPSVPGIYTSNWQLLDAAGLPVPDSTGAPLNFTVNIEVLAAAANILPAPLFYLRGEEDARQIWRMEPDGFTLTQLTQESAGVSGFEVNPVDNRLAYVSDYQLILLDPVNANRQILVAGNENDSPYRPVFSNDGAYLAYGLGGIHIYTLASGEDRLILPNNDIMTPSERRHFSPDSWSPDDSKLSVSIGYWEWGGSGIISTSDGSLLSEFEYADSDAWSTDSQTYFSARASEPGMMSTVPGLYIINASLNASEQTLIPDTFIWWPHQGADGRLVFFQGTPDPITPSQYNISLMGPSAEAVGQWQVLRSNILHLTAGGFPEAVWSPDGNFLAARLFHVPGKTSEVILLSLQDAPNLYLMQDGTNLRFGR
jgi:TolB protein